MKSFRLLIGAGLIALAALSYSANALTPNRLEVLFGGGCPVKAGSTCASVDANFAANKFFVNGIGFVPPSNLFTVVRAQTVNSYATDTAGNLIPFAANTLRITNQGLLVEEARTNDALWARDLTNAAWVKVNTTTALNATGADGTANAATTLTATAGNATVLQTITLGSQADTSSVYLKCITCTGAIQITENNGTAWATCANLITTNFVRCSVTATLANPIIGLRIVNSGDSVVADFFQMEPGGFVTSSIPTTTAAVTRNADQVAIMGASLTLLEAASGSIVVQTSSIVNGEGADSPSIVGGDSAVNDWYLRIGTATILNSKFNNITLSANLGGSGNYQTGVVKSAVGWSASGRSIVASNGTVATDGNTLTIPAKAWIGAVGNVATSFADGYFQRISIWNNRLPDATLQGLTK